MANLSKWGKEVKKALIENDMTLKQLASEVGYCVTTVSALINGRWAKPNYKEVAEKINGTLKIKGLPPRPEVPTEEWCKSVKKTLIEKNMTMNQLAADTGFSRDRVSLTVNGHCMDKPVIKSINQLLHIEEPVFPSDT